MSTKPAVLQIIPELETGGAERTTIDIARALCEAGWTALVVSAGGRLVGELTASGAEHIAMPMRSKSPPVMGVSTARLVGLIRKREIALIHARSRAPAWAAWLAAKATGRPLVTTYHGIYQQSSALKGLYNSVMARGDAVIANSAFTADLIRQRHPFAAGRIEVIHRGTDLNLFDPAAVEPARIKRLRERWRVRLDRPVLLHLARLTGWKGQRVTIEAAARIAAGTQAHPLVILAGDDQGREDYRAALQAMIAERDLGDVVRLVGHCDDPAAAFALADVALMPSTEPEAFGRVAVEAQAMGVPVVVSDHGAITETVVDRPAGRTGWRVAVGDADALAAACLEALGQTPGERTALANRARANAARFSVGAMQSATLGVYETLLDKTGRPTQRSITGRAQAAG